MSVRTRLRTAAMIWGAAPLRNRERSSPKVTSRSQWRLSIVFPQMTKRLVGPIGGGRHDVADLHVVPDHDDAVDHEFHQRAPLGESGALKPVPHLRAERLHRGRHRLQFEVLSRAGVDLPLLRHETLFPSLQFLALALELGQLHYLRQIGVQEPLLLTLALGERVVARPVAPPPPRR